MADLSITIDKESLVIIEDKETDSLLGTGSVFIRSNWVLTAKHVVVQDNLARQNLNVVFNTKKIAGTVIYTHKEVDLAVLEISENIFLRPLTAGHASLVGSGGLISVGYSPLNTKTLSTPSIKVERIDTFNSEQRERTFGTEELIVFPAPNSEGGNSGGPILGEGASIVGVIIQNFVSEDKVYARATSISPLLNELLLPAYPR